MARRTRRLPFQLLLTFLLTVDCCLPPSFAQVLGPAGRNAKGRCARHFKQPVTSKTALGGAPTCFVWQSPVNWVSRDSQILVFTRSLIFASSARPARVNVPRTSTWPVSSPSSFTSFTETVVYPGVINSLATWRKSDALDAQWLRSQT